MVKSDVFAFGVGCFVGAIGMFIGLRSYYETKAEKEIEEMREFYLEKEKNEIDKAVAETNERVKNDIYKRFVSKYQPYDTVEPKRVDPAEAEHPKEEDDEDEEYMEVAPKKARSDIYEISRDECEDSGYETLFYYYDDDTLADEDGNIVDEDEVLGDVLTASDFKDVLNKETVIFVQNGKLDAKYEVIKILDSYRESAGKGD